MPWKANPLASLPLSELYKELNPLQMQFFTMLDAELDKVNSFYAMKETELQDRTQVLIEQFKELNEHRRMVYVSLFISLIKFILKPKHQRAQPSKTPIWRLAWNRTLRSMPASSTSDEDIGEGFSRSGFAVCHFLRSCVPILTRIFQHRGKKDPNFGTGRAEHRERRGAAHSSDPGDYLQAKKRLKKAVLEHYRQVHITDMA